MSFQPLEVTATWDPEAQVWVAESENIPGLITEAPTKETLLEKLREIIPILLEKNKHWRVGSGHIPTSLMWCESEMVSL